MLTSASRQHKKNTSPNISKLCQDSKDSWKPCSESTLKIKRITPVPEFTDCEPPDPPFFVCEEGFQPSAGFMVRREALNDFKIKAREDVGASDF